MCFQTSDVSFSFAAGAVIGRAWVQVPVCRFPVEPAVIIRSSLQIAEAQIMLLNNAAIATVADIKAPSLLL